jgi:hypothetical protein
MELDSARTSERAPRIAYSGARGSEEIIVAFFCSARYDVLFPALVFCCATSWCLSGEGANDGEGMK